MMQLVQQQQQLAPNPMPLKRLPPPVPQSSPQELLQAVRNVLPDYALRRLAAIENNTGTFIKKTGKLTTIDTKVGALFAERAIFKSGAKRSINALLRSPWMINKTQYIIAINATMPK